MTEQRLASKSQGRRTGFARSEDGSFIVFGLFIFVMILMVGGMAVDFMRYETQRARLQSTIDRAVLAAASLDQALDPTEVVLDYVQRAGLGDYVTADDITVTGSAYTRHVDVDVSMEVPSIFLNLVGIPQIDAPGRASAQQMASQTEISLVLDVSGSMGSTAGGTNDTRIEVLQDAAGTFVNMVLCDPADPTKTTDCKVRKGSVGVNIVPYAEQVSAGETILSRLNATSEHSYSSCVHFDATDYETAAITTATPLQRAGHFDPWSWGSDPASYNRTCRTETSREITAWEDDVPTLQSRIDALSAGGNTSIDIGMKWGAALLDPAFQGVVDSLIEDGEISTVYDEFPLSWDTRGVQKVIVLMTDGRNTSEHYLYDDFRSGPSPIFTSLDETVADREISVVDAGDVSTPNDDKYYWTHLDYYQYYPQDRPYGAGTVPDCADPNDNTKPWRWSTCDWIEGPGAQALDYTEVWARYTWSWWDQWDFLPSPGTYQYWDKNNRLDDICTAAKTEGMKIFTIGFDTDDTQDTILRSCASEAGYYFNANGLNLEDIFALIAREVSRLKLVN